MRARGHVAALCQPVVSPNTPPISCRDVLIAGAGAEIRVLAAGTAPAVATGFAAGARCSCHGHAAARPVSSPHRAADGGQGGLDRRRSGEAGHTAAPPAGGAGHECAYFDSTLLFPANTLTNGSDLTGVYVLDMTDPAHPVKTDNLSTPAMQSPHESLYLNATRALLVADMGYPTFNPGFVDIYDVTQDCRHPV